MCAKFGDDRLWNEKALADPKFDTTPKTTTTFVAIGPVLGPKNTFQGILSPGNLSTLFNRQFRAIVFWSLMSVMRFTEYFKAYRNYYWNAVVSYCVVVIVVITCVLVAAAIIIVTVGLYMCLQASRYIFIVTLIINIIIAVMFGLKMLLQTARDESKTRKSIAST